MQFDPVIYKDHCFYKNNSEITIYTDRIILRNINFSDIDLLCKYANNYDVAFKMNGSIPFPYTIEAAKDWVLKHNSDNLTSKAISWAIASKADNSLMGSIQLRMDEQGKIARLSYWLGETFWGQKLISEAAEAIVRYGFQRLKLEKIEAEVFSKNLPSKKILEKLGFTYKETTQKEEKLSNSKIDFEMHVLLPENIKL